MKKIIFLLTLCAVIAGCGGGGSDQVADPAPTPVPSTPPAAVRNPFAGALPASSLPNANAPSDLSMGGLKSSIEEKKAMRSPG